MEFKKVSLEKSKKNTFQSNDGNKLFHSKEFDFVKAHIWSLHLGENLMVGNVSENSITNDLVFLKGLVTKEIQCFGCLRIFYTFLLVHSS